MIYRTIIHITKNYNFKQRKLFNLKSIVLTLFFTIAFSLYPGKLTAQDDVTEVAWELANNGELQQAINRISKAIEQNPKNIKYLVPRAYFYFMAKEYDSSLNDCKEYVSINSNDKDIYMFMGYIYTLKGNYLEAVKVYSKALNYSKLMVDKQLCHLKRSIAYNKAELYKEAMKDLEESKGIFSSDSLYLYNLAFAQIHLNNVEEAKSTLNILNEKYPEYPKMYSLKASIYYSTGDYPKALSMLKEYTKLTTAEKKQYEMLYELAMQQKDTLTAIEALETKTIRYGGSFDEDILLAKMYYFTGNYTKASIAVENAAKKTTEEALIYKLKGDIFFKRNNDRACDFYFIAIKKGYLKDYNEDLLQTYIQSCE